MLWHDLMHVDLAPELVTYRLQSPLGRTSKTVEQIACQPGDAARPWANAVAALSKAMTENMQRHLRLNVMVSDRLVRYLVLPWRPGIVSRAEWRAYAQHQFESVYGEAAREWRLRIELVPPGRPSLACAIDAELYDVLRTVAVANASRLVAMRSNFIGLFNQRRAVLRGSPLWFGYAERRSICLGLLVDGVWRAIRNEATPDGWQAALPGLVTRMQVMAGDTGVGTIFLLAEERGGPIPETIGGQALRLLDANPHRASPATALAAEA